MATIRLTKGGEDIANLLINVNKAADAIGKIATYEGAKVIADGIRQSIGSLVVDTPRWLNDGDCYSVIVRQDKEDLANALGIAEITKDEDGVRTVIGFAGYGRHKTKKYPKGLPMPMIARSVENGSSVRRASPFVRPVVSAKRKAARAAMAKAGNEAIQKLIKEKG